MNEEEKKKKIAIFTTRLILFTAFACILPFSFIAWRYQIFRRVDKMALSGWGLIAIIIVFVFAIYVIKMVRRGLPYSMFTQVLNGFCAVLLPLLCVYAVLNSIKDNIDIFLQSLSVVIVCEAVAIPVNPLPKWCVDHHIEMGEKVLDRAVDKFWEGSRKEIKK